MHLYVSCATLCGSSGGCIGCGRMPSDTAWLLICICRGRGAGLCRAPCDTAISATSGAAALQAKWVQMKQLQILRPSGSIRRLSLPFSRALPRGVAFGPLPPFRAAARASGIEDMAGQGTVGVGTRILGRRGAPVGVFVSACPAVARVAWWLLLRGSRARQGLAPTVGLLRRRSTTGPAGQAVNTLSRNVLRPLLRETRELAATLL